MKTNFFDTINFSHLNDISNLPINILFFQILKILFIVGFGLYAIFAFVTTRQIEIMRQTVVTPLSNAIRLVGYIHLFVAIGMIVYVLRFLP